jgi:hypothetical protein
MKNKMKQKKQRKGSENGPSRLAYTAAVGVRRAVTADLVGV